MTTWIFEPGHTAAEFRAVHMMVTWVRGLFKDIHGQMEFDWDSCLDATFEGEIDATKLWTGEPVRDEHLRSADFFDTDNHPKIPFSGRFVKRTGARSFEADSELTIRGNKRHVPLSVDYLGEWETPFWVGDENRGTMRRLGWKAHGRLNRHDFDVSWQDELPNGGIVVGDVIEVDLDVEVINKDDLEKTGAIEHYVSATKGWRGPESNR